MRRLNGNLTYVNRPRDSAVRAVITRLGFSRTDRLSNGLVESEFINFRYLEVQNHRGDRIGFSYQPQRENLFEDFEIEDGVVIPSGDYQWNNHRVELRTGPQRKIAGSLQYDSGDFYGGTKTALSPQIAWRPSEHFLFDLSYQINEVDLPQGSFTTRLTRFRAEIVFSSRLSWVNLIQWDNDSRVMGFNSRLHWVPQAGQEAFFVINHNLQDDDRNDSYHSQSADITLKFNYTFRY
jgi:hypothetical protein